MNYDNFQKRVKFYNSGTPSTLTKHGPHSTKVIPIKTFNIKIIYLLSNFRNNNYKLVTYTRMYTSLYLTISIEIVEIILL